MVPLLRRSRPRSRRTAAILGKLCRDDFELWVCRAPGGRLSLKWWRWREDAEPSTPLEDGALTLDAEELQPLADLLASVATFLERRKL